MKDDKISIITRITRNEADKGGILKVNCLDIYNHNSFDSPF